MTTAGSYKKLIVMDIENESVGIIRPDFFHRLNPLSVRELFPFPHRAV